MTAGKQRPVTDATGSSVADKAALFVVFYVDEEEEQPLYERLRSLARQTQEAFPQGERSPDDEPLLACLDLPAAHDAIAILLILNAPGDAATAWATMRQRLEEDILGALDLPAVWWGYTIVYQAVLKEGLDAGLAFEELLPAIRRTHSSEGPRRPLGEARLPGDGRVWLLDVPLRADDPAATVLVALSPPEGEEALKGVLFGTTLLMADLIAHKGYALKREYSDDRQLTYKRRLKTFWAVADEFLCAPADRTEERERIDQVTSWYGILTNIVSKFNRMNISMAQQLHNYGRWRASMEGNDIVEYHHGHLQTANRELELLVAEGRDALGVADKALSMAQVKLERLQESRQRMLEFLLAVVGAALAVPELINAATARKLLERTLGLQNPDFLVVFSAQLAAIVVAAVLILVLVRLIDKLRASRLLARRRTHAPTTGRSPHKGRGGVY